MFDDTRQNHSINYKYLSLTVFPICTHFIPPPLHQFIFKMATIKTHKGLSFQLLYDQKQIDSIVHQLA